MSSQTFGQQPGCPLQWQYEYNNSAGIHIDLRNVANSNMTQNNDKTMPKINKKGTKKLNKNKRKATNSTREAT